MIRVNKGFKNIMKAKKFTKETIKSIGISNKVLPDFAVGDVVAVSQWVIEGKEAKDVKAGKTGASKKDAAEAKTERIQIFEGNIIAIKNGGASSTFTVRKVGKDGIAVERIYPIHSPNVESVNIISKAKVRRAKLYYLRDRVGKAARVKERIEKKSLAV